MTLNRIKPATLPLPWRAAALRYWWVLLLGAVFPHAVGLMLKNESFSTLAFGALLPFVSLFDLAFPLLLVLGGRVKISFWLLFMLVQMGSLSLVILISLAVEVVVG